MLSVKQKFQKLSVDGKSQHLNEISPNIPIDRLALVQLKGLVPNRQDAITWTKDEPVHYWHMASLRHNELTHCGLVTPYGDINLGQHWLR